ncbi:hypothetical protein ERD80_17775, partial [Pantoea sp. R102]
MSDKLARLQQALAHWQLDAVLLTRRDNIAWLTDGASYYVVERAETGVASLLIGRDSVLLLALTYGLRGVAYPMFAYAFLVWIQSAAPAEMRGSATGW